MIKMSCHVSKYADFTMICLAPSIKMTYTDHWFFTKICILYLKRPHMIILVGGWFKQIDISHFLYEQKLSWSWLFAEIFKIKLVTLSVVNWIALSRDKNVDLHVISPNSLCIHYYECAGSRKPARFEPSTFLLFTVERSRASARQITWLPTKIGRKMAASENLTQWAALEDIFSGSMSPIYKP